MCDLARLTLRYKGPARGAREHVDTWFAPFAALDIDAASFIP